MSELLDARTLPSHPSQVTEPVLMVLSMNRQEQRFSGWIKDDSPFAEGTLLLGKLFRLIQVCAAVSEEVRPVQICIRFS